MLSNMLQKEVGGEIVLSDSSDLEKEEIEKLE